MGLDLLSLLDTNTNEDLKGDLLAGCEKPIARFLDYAKLNLPEVIFDTSRSLGLEDLPNNKYYGGYVEFHSNLILRYLIDSDLDIESWDFRYLWFMYKVTKDRYLTLCMY
jgi:hypothetical protein